MKISEKLCPKDKYPVKCPYLRVADRIVVHNTANDAPAANEISYMISRPEEVSFHYAVDDVEAVQGLPLERNAWASGDGRGDGNMKGIHIEICWSLSGGERFRKAEENAAGLIAGLLREKGWGIDRVTKHQDYDGKYCPHRTLDMGWERFLEMIKERMAEEMAGDGGTGYGKFLEYMERYEQEKRSRQVSQWAKGSWEKLTKEGIFDGTGPRDSLTREQAAAVIERLRNAA